MDIKNIGFDTYRALCNSNKTKVETNADINKKSCLISDSSMTLNEKKEDTIELSEEALKIIEKKKCEAEKAREFLLNKQSLERDMKAAQQQSDAVAEEMKKKIAMLKIMQRIANGDKVPAKDEKALMEYDSEMYQAAKMTAQMRKNSKPREYDSALEDEEETQEITESDDECEIASAEVDTETSEAEAEA